VREALFSILGPLDGMRVLDLFAGSGALAIEALSRGAAAATLVDSSAAAIAAAKRNLESIGVEAVLRRQDVFGFLRNARANARDYDLVFLDPPYRRASTLGAQLAEALGPVLASGARVVCESDRRAPLELPLAGAGEPQQRRYGDTLISIYDT
jgi:16S rRNA (guanine966-N2)-methyltransferase